MLEHFSNLFNRAKSAISQRYNKMHIEPYLVSINWLLFIYAWFIFFHIAPSGFLSLIVITSLPIIGLFIPTILEAISRYFWGDKPTNAQDTNASTISTEYDNIHNASAKFALHSFIHINIIYCTLKTLCMTYGLTYIGIASIFIAATVGLLMLPIIFKELSSLITVLRNGGGTKNIDKANSFDHRLENKKLLISLVVGASVSALVFYIMIISTIYIPTIFPLVYMPLLFISNLVVLDFFVLVTYLHYIRQKYGDENLNWQRVTMNIITFITATFGLLLTIFQVTAKSSMFHAHSVIFSCMLTAISSAGIYMLFPTLFIFGLGISGILINDPTKAPQDAAKAEEIHNQTSTQQDTPEDTPELIPEATPELATTLVTK